MAQAAPTPLPEETLALINTRVTSVFNDWNANATAEQKAAGNQLLENLKNN